MMRPLLVATLLLALRFSVDAKTSFPFAGSTVELLDSAEAAALNGISDAYTNALTPFDLAIRLNNPTGATEADYLRRAAAAVHNWPANEAADLQRAFSGVETALAAHEITLPLPHSIQLIKTDGTEEFGAEGYTRGARIMLNTTAEPSSVHLVAHELFHVVSHANPGLRDRVYLEFGFRPCAPIAVAKALDGRGITNPDCPVLEHYINLADGKVLKSYALVLYSKQGYKAGGSLGDYAAVGLLELTGTEKKKAPLMDGGKAVVHELGEVPALFKEIGTNTQYLLHPEEISAEHFAMLVAGEEAREPQFLERVEAVLRK